MMMEVWKKKKTLCFWIKVEIRCEQELYGNLFSFEMFFILTSALLFTIIGQQISDQRDLSKSACDEWNGPNNETKI